MENKTVSFDKSEAIVILARLEGKDLKSIAGANGCSPEKAQMLLGKVVNKLKEFIAE